MDEIHDSSIALLRLVSGPKKAVGTGKEQDKLISTTIYMVTPGGALGILKFSSNTLKKYSNKNILLSFVIPAAKSLWGKI
jgi:hypothetical protein